MFKYNERIIIGCLRTWHGCAKGEKIANRQKQKTYIIPISLVKADVCRALKFLEKEYGYRYMMLPIMYYRDGYTQKEIQNKFNITYTEYKKVIKNAIQLMIEFLNGEFS
jgi:hypothetical protein